ncbi:MAG: hypothetical protein RBT73_12625, partial [Spirochaetia bacterium]|nr:hypothetical protein [Spirochaetia bacterium]
MGESPGDMEVRKGEPFVGPAGEMLSGNLRNAGLIRERAWLTNLISCFPGDTTVSAWGIERGYKRFYKGPLIEVKTPRGVLTGTPNHPVLTQRGWVALNLLVEGDYLVRYLGVENGGILPLGEPYIEGRNAHFDQIYDSLFMKWRRMRMPGGVVDFHGDGQKSNVDVIISDGLLGNPDESSKAKKLKYIILKHSLERFSTLLRKGNLSKYEVYKLWRMLPAFRGLVCILDHVSSLLWGRVFPSKKHSFCGGTEKPQIFQQGASPSVTNFELPIDILRTYPGQITFDNILSLRYSKFSGHVYNLQTFSGHYIANGYFVSNCRPPHNDLDSPEGRLALECCRPGLEAEIEYLEDHGAKVWVPLGSKPLLALGVEGGISLRRGYVYEREGLVLVPTFHPSFLLRGNFEEIPTTISDLRKAGRLAREGWTPPAPRFKTHPTLRDVEAFATRVLRTRALLALDIETTSLIPERGEILVVGLAESATSAISIPFLCSGGSRYWSMKDFARVRTLLKKILATCPVIIHNATYDMAFLRAKGFKVGNLAHDTLLLSHAIHPELKHRQSYVASVYAD